MTWLFFFFTVSILILFNSLYVAAEFSTVSARRARLAQFAEEGNRAAASLLPIVQDPKKLDRYIATCQVGITISSLIMGFFGQGQLAEAIAPYLGRFGQMSEAAVVSTSTTLVLLALSGLQVLFGELVPKNIGIQMPERLAMLTLLPMRWSITILRPLIWFLNGSGELLLRLLGLEAHAEHTHVHSPEEIAMLVKESHVGGALKSEEGRLLVNALQSRSAMAKQVMIPRTQMLAAPATMALPEMRGLLAKSPHSRLLIYDKTIDNLRGFVHLKDLLCFDLNSKPAGLDKMLHRLHYAPQTAPVSEIFATLQKNHLQVAIVLDEFGGTAGMLTTEDLIEEIFGEIEDEFDIRNMAMRIWRDNTISISSSTPVSEIENRLGIELENGKPKTLGGLIQETIGHLPAIGEEITIGSVTFRVETTSAQGAFFVSLRPTAQQRERFLESFK